MAKVPGIKRGRAGFLPTRSDWKIVNCSADNTGFGGLPERIAIFRGIQCYRTEAFTHDIEE